MVGCERGRPARIRGHDHTFLGSRDQSLGLPAAASYGEVSAGASWVEVEERWHSEP